VTSESGFHTKFTESCITEDPEALIHKPDERSDTGNNKSGRSRDRSVFSLIFSLRPPR